MGRVGRAGRRIISYRCRQIAVGVHITGVRQRVVILDQEFDVRARVALASALELRFGGLVEAVESQTTRRGKAR